ncbi:pyridoxal phosphate-dependent aminotransferase [bacterium]|nr:MAG: pyridoxal phosphate-dependent aminotransferase [bacterium]
MTGPALSAHFASRKPSVIRLAQIEHAKRTDGVAALNVAIGNVSLPMHPAMAARLATMGTPGGAFADGVVSYTATSGTAECNAAVLNVIAASGGDVTSLQSTITSGGSQAMELVVVGCCGPAGSDERPLLLVDAAYTNYTAFAERMGRRTASITRTLGDDGRFSLPDLDTITEVVEREKPGALVVIPYDNPTGQLYTREQLADLARICVAHDMWIISDEAYRELHYDGTPPVSIWSLTEDEVPGLTGRRIGIETASKVWNACGIRIGALVTDNPDFHARGVAEQTASLCSSAIGQHLFAALADESHADLQEWFAGQRGYYQAMLEDLTTRVRDLLPGVIVSSPDASIYSVVDLRALVDEKFDALDFVLYCAQQGSVEMDGEQRTLLTAPMAGFYSMPAGEPNPGRTQLRIAYVASPPEMARVPELLAGLFAAYQAR